jgi:hypothetical protein
MPYNPEDHLREYEHGWEVSWKLGDGRHHFGNSKYLKFKDEVLTWIDENITGGWSLPQDFSFASFGTSPVFFMSFEDEDDLIAFHMKWL